MKRNRFFIQDLCIRGVTVVLLFQIDYTIESKKGSFAVIDNGSVMEGRRHMRKKWMAGCLAGVLAAMSLSGCASSPDSEQTGGGAVQYGAVEEQDYTPDPAALRIGYDTQLASMQPLYAETAVEQEIVSLTQENLFAVDRSGNVVQEGIAGETVAYNGVDYTYEGLADVEIEQDVENDMTVYHITLRKDAKFADGEQVDADDLIFTLYLLSDTSYDGPYMLYQTPIVGMTNYRLDAPADVTVEEVEITQALEEKNEELETMITREIILPVLKEEFAWCQSLYEASDYDMLTKQYDTPAELFYHFYGLESYEKIASSENIQEALENVPELVAEEYGGDYRKLGQIYGDDAELYEESARRIAAEYLIAEKIASGQSGKAPNISGIHRVSDYQVDIYTNGYDETCIYQLNVPVLPLHYYGDVNLYNYSENQFGFTKGDLSGIVSQNKLPMGAGAYRMLSEREGSLYLTANEVYYKGVPHISSIQYLPVKEDEKIPLLSNGEIDVVQMQDSQANLNKIQEKNSNDAITGDVIYTSLSDTLGYGYIGINSETVNIGQKGDSKASKALRTALAVMLAYYREQAVNDYFGGTGSVLDYPISEAFLAAPKTSDKEYQRAYSKDIYGTELYTEDMDEEACKEAMEKAVLEYLKEAGYSVKGGKVVKAPQGGTNAFDVLIAAEEEAGAPFYTLLVLARENLKELGITLNICDVKTEHALTEALESGDYQLWCSVKEEGMYPDLYAAYGSGGNLGENGKDNLYHIGDRTLDQKLSALNTESDPELSKKMYQECLELILEQAVEIPVYQCRSCILFSGHTVNTDTIAEDLTGFYSWTQEIELLELN